MPPGSSETSPDAADTPSGGSAYTSGPSRTSSGASETSLGASETISGASGTTLEPSGTTLEASGCVSEGPEVYQKLPNVYWEVQNVYWRLPKVFRRDPESFRSLLKAFREHPAAFWKLPDELPASAEGRLFRVDLSRAGTWGGLPTPPKATKVSTWVLGASHAASSRTASVSRPTKSGPEVGRRPRRGFCPSVRPPPGLPPDPTRPRPGGEGPSAQRLRTDRSRKKDAAWADAGGGAPSFARIPRSGRGLAAAVAEL